MQAPPPAGISSHQNETPLEQVQREIIASLFNGLRLSRKSRSEQYLEHRLNSLSKRNRMCSFRLAWTPLDDDFIYLCYQLIFRRAPDPAGFRHLQMLLVTRTATRLEVLMSLLASPEARDILAESDTAHSPPVLLAHARKFAARIPMLNPLCWATWRALSAISRQHRMELQKLDAGENLQELHDMLSDTLEYVHNKKSGKPVFFSHGQ